MPNKLIFIALFLIQFSSFAQEQNINNQKAIHSGVPWYDNNGNIVSAHGACIVKDNGLFYLFGESKSDTSNAFEGFSCYSSADLYNWKFEKMALPVQENGNLGSKRVGERVKVMKCPKTGKYIMFMHVDNLLYKDQFVGYATSKTINGTYSYQGALLFNGAPVKKWDIGVFQDTDGSGFVITHSGNLFKLSDDYKSITEQVVKNMTGQCEAPVIFKKDGIYFWLGSGLTAWERNDNYYFTATDLKGPWIEHGIFAPKNSLTWNSQTTFVFPIKGAQDTTFLFMGDRWAYPRQKSAATYVWQPLEVKGNTISIPNFIQSLQIDNATGKWNSFAIEGKTIVNSNTKSIKYKGKWNHAKASDSLAISSSESKDASFSIDFKGTQIALYGLAQPSGGYAKVFLEDSKGKIVLSSIIEMYCKYPETSLKFLSPVLIKGNYKLSVTVIGDHGNWTNKKGTLFGSTGNVISISKAVVVE